ADSGYLSRNSCDTVHSGWIQKQGSSAPGALMGWATRCRHDEMGCVGDGDTERVGTDPARTRGRLGEAIRTISPVRWERAMGAAYPTRPRWCAAAVGFKCLALFLQNLDGTFPRIMVWAGMKNGLCNKPRFVYKHHYGLCIHSYCIAVLAARADRQDEVRHRSAMRWG
ncbi:hypothetical protein V497_08732, partial [Pseudogymnoascus sp. VKM F-4516 (FW-969)]